MVQPEQVTLESSADDDDGYDDSSGYDSSSDGSDDAAGQVETPSVKTVTANTANAAATSLVSSNNGVSAVDLQMTQTMVLEAEPAEDLVVISDAVSCDSWIGQAIRSSQFLAVVRTPAAPSNSLIIEASLAEKFGLPIEVRQRPWVALRVRRRLSDPRVPLAVLNALCEQLVEAGVEPRTLVPVDSRSYILIARDRVQAATAVLVQLGHLVSPMARLCPLEEAPVTDPEHLKPHVGIWQLVGSASVEDYAFAPSDPIASASVRIQAENGLFVEFRVPGQGRESGIVACCGVLALNARDATKGTRHVSVSFQPPVGAPPPLHRMVFDGTGENITMREEMPGVSGESIVEQWRKLVGGDQKVTALELTDRVIKPASGAKKNSRGAWLFSGKYFAYLAGPPLGEGIVGITCCRSLAHLEVLHGKEAVQTELRRDYEVVLGKVERPGLLVVIRDAWDAGRKGAVFYDAKAASGSKGSGSIEVQLEDGFVQRKLPSGELQKWRIHDWAFDPFTPPPPPRSAIPPSSSASDDEEEEEEERDADGSSSNAKCTSKHADNDSDSSDGKDAKKKKKKDAKKRKSSAQDIANSSSSEPPPSPKKKKSKKDRKRKGGEKKTSQEDRKAKKKGRCRSRKGRDDKKNKNSRQRSRSGSDAEAKKKNKQGQKKDKGKEKNKTKDKERRSSRNRPLGRKRKRSRSSRDKKASSRSRTRRRKASRSRRRSDSSTRKKKIKKRKASSSRSHSRHNSRSRHHKKRSSSRSRHRSRSKKHSASRKRDKRSASSSSSRSRKKKTSSKWSKKSRSTSRRKAVADDTPAARAAAAAKELEISLAAKAQSDASMHKKLTAKDAEKVKSAAKAQAEAADAEANKKMTARDAEKLYLEKLQAKSQGGVDVSKQEETRASNEKPETETAPVAVDPSTSTSRDIASNTNVKDIIPEEVQVVEDGHTPINNISQIASPHEQVPADSATIKSDGVKTVQGGENVGAETCRVGEEVLPTKLADGNSENTSGTGGENTIAEAVKAKENVGKEGEAAEADESCPISEVVRHSTEPSAKPLQSSEPGEEGDNGEDTTEVKDDPDYDPFSEVPVHNDTEEALLGEKEQELKGDGTMKETVLGTLDQGNANSKILPVGSVLSESVVVGHAENGSDSMPKTSSLGSSLPNSNSTSALDPKCVQQEATATAPALVSSAGVLPHPQQGGLPVPSAPSQQDTLVSPVGSDQKQDLKESIIEAPLSMLAVPGNTIPCSSVSTVQVKPNPASSPSTEAVSLPPLTSGQGSVQKESIASASGSDVVAPGATCGAISTVSALALASSLVGASVQPQQVMPTAASPSAGAVGFPPKAPPTVAILGSGVAPLGSTHGITPTVPALGPSIGSVAQPPQAILTPTQVMQTQVPAPPPGAAPFATSVPDLVSAFVVQNQLTAAAEKTLRDLPTHLAIQVMRRGPLEGADKSASLILRVQTVVADASKVQMQSSQSQPAVMLPPPPQQHAVVTSLQQAVGAAPQQGALQQSVTVGCSPHSTGVVSTDRLTQFCKQNGVNADVEQVLRGAPVDLQLEVMAEGPLVGVEGSPPSEVLIARVRRMMGQTQA